MRILIVEDDRKLAHQLKKGMEEQGHVVAVELEGMAGLEAARRGEFDVLVLDVMLPGLDGFSIVLLKRPAEVTELMRVDGETRYFEESGKPMQLADLRAGDTVFIMSKPTGGQPVAVTIHKGPMTLDLLRERYLKK